MKGKPRVVYPVKKTKGLQDLLMGGGADDEDGFEEETSFADRLVSRIADRITGVRSSDHQSRPAGLYVLWNGAR